MVFAVDEPRGNTYSALVRSTRAPRCLYWMGYGFTLTGERAKGCGSVRCWAAERNMVRIWVAEGILVDVVVVVGKTFDVQCTVEPGDC